MEKVSETAQESQQNVNKKSKLNKIFIEYTGVSPIHGFHHFGEKKNFPKIEIFFWIVIFIVSFVLCFYMIFNLWSKWDENPLVVTFDNNFKYVREIPVPAVTICSSTKTSKESVNILENFKNLKNKTPIEPRQ